jgi:hypothetical protein
MFLQTSNDVSCKTSLLVYQPLLMFSATYPYVFLKAQGEEMAAELVGRADSVTLQETFPETVTSKT